MTIDEAFCGHSTVYERALMRIMIFCVVRANRLLRARIRPGVINRISRREQFLRFVNGRCFAALNRRGWMADPTYDRYIKGPRPLPPEACQNIIREAQRMAKESPARALNCN